MAVSLSLIGGPRVEAEEFGVTGPFDRPKINFIQGGATAISVVDNPGLDKVDVTITSTDTGGPLGSSYETGRAQVGNIPSGTGTYAVSGSWPGSFTPHGILLVTGSSTSPEEFFAVGFAAANLGGILSQAFVGVYTGSPFSTNAGGSLSFSNSSTIITNTPASNQWDVQRIGSPSAGAWNYASFILGRATV